MCTRAPALSCPNESNLMRGDRGALISGMRQDASYHMTHMRVEPFLSPSRPSSPQAFNTKLKLRFLLDPLDMKPDMTAMAARAGPDPQQWNFAPVSTWLSQAGAPQVAILTAPAGTGTTGCLRPPLFQGAPRGRV